MGARSCAVDVEHRVGVGAYGVVEARSYAFKAFDDLTEADGRTVVLTQHLSVKLSNMVQFRNLTKLCPFRTTNRLFVVVAGVNAPPR